MKSTTYFGLQSQTTRLVNQLTPIEIYAEIKYGILTLFRAPTVRLLLRAIRKHQDRSMVPLAVPTYIHFHSA